jgi:3-dehydroquinate synthase
LRLEQRAVKHTGASIVRVRTATGGYDVHFGFGVLADLATLLEAHANTHHYAIISDSNVARLHAEPLHRQLGDAGLSATVFPFEAGEANKTRETWADVTDRMLAAGIGRDGCVIAVGGGVTGDLAGFVAATYMRGIALVAVPTSLLAMIDASIGGKTGVDTSAGKNLIGAFHPPRLVVSDAATLATLPEEEFTAGLAEAVKHGAIADSQYLVWLEAEAPGILGRDPSLLQTLIRRSIEIKADFVADDEREAGRRAALNFGHTVGHAIERLTDYRISHGSAISVGMVAEAKLGEAIGRTAPGTAQSIERALRAFGLETGMPAGITIPSLVRATASDKKAAEGRVRYALVASPGHVVEVGGEWTHPVSFEQVVSALEG